MRVVCIIYWIKGTCGSKGLSQLPSRHYSCPRRNESFDYTGFYVERIANKSLFVSILHFIFTRLRGDVVLTMRKITDGNRIIFPQLYPCLKCDDERPNVASLLCSVSDRLPATAILLSSIVQSPFVANCDKETILKNEINLQI